MKIYESGNLPVVSVRELHKMADSKITSNWLYLVSMMKTFCSAGRRLFYILPRRGFACMLCPVLYHELRFMRQIVTGGIKAGFSREGSQAFI